jgi:hypothetical protein
MKKHPFFKVKKKNFQSEKNFFLKNLDWEKLSVKKIEPPLKVISVKKKKKKFQV